MNLFCPGRRWRQDISILRLGSIAIGIKRKNHAENRSFHRSGFDGHIAAMILHNFLHDSQSETSPIFLAIADEGLEKFTSNRLGNAAPIVMHTNLDSPWEALEFDFNTASLDGNRLAP